jgi:hypothetical protein
MTKRPRLRAIQVQRGQRGRFSASYHVVCDDVVVGHADFSSDFFDGSNPTMDLHARYNLTVGGRTVLAEPIRWPAAKEARRRLRVALSRLDCEAVRREKRD